MAMTERKVFALSNATGNHFTPNSALDLKGLKTASTADANYFGNLDNVTHSLVNMHKELENYQRIQGLLNKIKHDNSSANSNLSLLTLVWEKMAVDRFIQTYHEMSYRLGHEYLVTYSVKDGESLISFLNTSWSALSETMRAETEEFLQTKELCELNEMTASKELDSFHRRVLIAASNNPLSDELRKELTTLFKFVYDTILKKHQSQLQTALARLNKPTAQLANCLKTINESIEKLEIHKGQKVSSALIRLIIVDLDILNTKIAITSLRSASSKTFSAKDLKSFAELKTLEALIDRLESNLHILDETINISTDLSGSLHKRLAEQAQRQYQDRIAALKNLYKIMPDEDKPSPEAQKMWDDQIKKILDAQIQRKKELEEELADYTKKQKYLQTALVKFSPHPALVGKLESLQVDAIRQWQLDAETEALPVKFNEFLALFDFTEATNEDERMQQLIRNMGTIAQFGSFIFYRCSKGTQKQMETEFAKQLQTSYDAERKIILEATNPFSDNILLLIIGYLSNDLLQMENNKVSWLEGLRHFCTHIIEEKFFLSTLKDSSTQDKVLNSALHLEAAVKNMFLDKKNNNALTNGGCVSLAMYAVTWNVNRSPSSTIELVNHIKYIAYQFNTTLKNLPGQSAVFFKRDPVSYFLQSATESKSDNKHSLLKTYLHNLGVAFNALKLRNDLTPDMHNLVLLAKDLMLVRNKEVHSGAELREHLGSTLKTLSSKEFEELINLSLRPSLKLARPE